MVWFTIADLLFRWVVLFAQRGHPRPPAGDHPIGVGQIFFIIQLAPAESGDIADAHQLLGGQLVHGGQIPAGQGRLVLHERLGLLHEAGRTGLVEADHADRFMGDVIRLQLLADPLELTAGGYHLHVIAVVAGLGVGDQGDRMAVVRIQQAPVDVRLEHGVTIDDHERSVHLVAHDPAGTQVVAVGVERIEGRADRHTAALVVLVHHELNLLCVEAGGDHDLAGTRLLQGVELPPQGGFVADRQDAFRGFFGQGQQSPTLAGAQNDRLHGVLQLR
jgi:hypothetical protein